MDHRDDELLQSWAHGRDEAALRTLCERHAGAVAAACRRQGSPDVDEAAQAVFLVLARRAGAVGQGCLAGWLSAAARRVTANQRRAAASRRHHEHEAAMEHVRQHAATGEPVWAEARRHLDEALNGLGAGQREAIVRFYLHGQPQATVAAELGCSVDAVKNRIHVGLERLRDRLARRGVALGAAAIASGLASEAATAEPAIAGACAQAVLVPGSAAGAATLAAGVTTAMIIKTTTLAAGALILVGSCLTAALSLAGEASSAAAIPPVPAAIAAPRDPSANAALDWWRAFDSLPKEGEPIWKLVDDPRSHLPDPAANAVFDRQCRPLELLALGATASYCAWGVDVAKEGAGAPLPYQGKMRSLIRLGILRARWHAARSEMAAALDDLLVCMRASRLFAGCQPILIDVMAGVSCETLAIHAAGGIAARLDAGQRKHFGAAVAGLPVATAAAEALDAEMALMHWGIARFLSLPIAERAQAMKAFTGDSGVLAPLRGTALASDASLKACLDAYPIEVARWKALLSLPPAERLRKEPTFTTGEQPPHALMGVFAPAWSSIGATEVRIILLREQLLAALEYLDRGEAGLAEHKDVLTGKPFRFETTATGFRLFSDIPGLKRGAELFVGEAPPAAAQEQPKDAAPPASGF